MLNQNFALAVVKKLYAVWLKVDDSLPWIELGHTYGTRQEAKRVARDLHMRIKVVKVSTRIQVDKPRKMSMLQSEVGRVLV